jgi:long-chain acyl-CoA synthetase
MALDVDLYRRTVYAPAGPKSKRLRRISVIDIAPEGYTQTLVLVHGYGGSALQWLYQLRAFGQGARVIAPDLRGHGGSDDPDELPASMDGLVDDLELALAGVGAEQSIALLAHSFGGAIAVEYALRHPEAASALVLIGVPSRFEIQRGARQLLSMPNGIYTFLQRRFHLPLLANHIRTLRRLHDRAMAPWPGVDRLKQLRLPTLVITGQRDTVFLRQHYEDVATHIPGAKSVVIPVSSHLVQLERPDAVNRAIHRFLEPPAPKGSAGAYGVAAPSSKPLGAKPLATRIAETPWLQHYDVEVPLDLPVPSTLLHDLLNNAANDYPDRAALVYFAQHIGYRELDRLSNRFAHALRKLGVAKDDRVAIVLPNVPQCVIGFFGTLKAGAVVVLASPLSTEDEIAAHLRDSGARVLLTLSSYADLVARVCPGSAVEHVISSDVREYLPLFERVALASRVEAMVKQRGADAIAVDQPRAAQATPYKRHALQQILRSQPSTLIDSGSAPDDLALLQYTSGTVDPPKGVMLTHRNLVTNVAQVRHWIPAARRGRETLLCVLPLAHSYGVTSGLDLCTALAGSLVLLPTTRTRQVVEAIKQHRPSLFPAVPALYLAIANYPKTRSYGISSVKYCISGSAPLPVEVQEAFEKLTRGRLVEGYGLTEASPVTHCNPLNGERRVGSIGVPLPGTFARIVDWHNGAPLPAGEVGELLVAGPQVMRGYWNLPDDTAAVLQDGWLRTGDLARMDEDGYFTIVDRKKDVILAGPYNVYPRDVEEVLYEHPKVLEAAVVGEPAGSKPPMAGSPIGGLDPATGGFTTDGAGSQSRLIKAVVVLRRGEKATPDELLAYLRERVDSYKVPRAIEFRSELPKNFVGKVLRRLLVQPEKTE